MSNRFRNGGRGVYGGSISPPLQGPFSAPTTALDPPEPTFSTSKTTTESKPNESPFESGLSNMQISDTKPIRQRSSSNLHITKPVVLDNKDDAEKFWAFAEIIKIQLLQNPSIGREDLDKPENVPKELRKPENLDRKNRFIDALADSLDELRRHLILGSMAQIMMDWLMVPGFTTKKRFDTVGARLHFWKRCYAEFPGHIYFWLRPFESIVNLNFIFSSDKESTYTAAVVKKKVKSYLDRLFLLVVDGTYTYIMCPRFICEAEYDEEACFGRMLEYLATIKDDSSLRGFYVPTDDWPSPPEGITKENAKKIRKLLENPSTEYQKLYDREEAQLAKDEIKRTEEEQKKNAAAESSHKMLQTEKEQYSNFGHHTPCTHLIFKPEPKTNELEHPLLFLRREPPRAINDAGCGECKECCEKRWHSTFRDYLQF